MNTKWGFPPTCNLFLNSGQPEGHGLLSGYLLHHVISESASELFIEWPEFLPSARGPPVLVHVYLDPIPGCSLGSGVLLCLGLAWQAAVGLLDGVVPVFGQAPPIGLAWCWSLPSLGGCKELVAEGAGAHKVSICSSVASPKKLANSAGNCSVSSRSLVRLKETCFYAGPWGKHSVADMGGEQGHPAVCVRVLSGHVLLTPLLLDSCCWGWRLSLLKEWCNHSSAWCGHSRLGVSKVCLWGLVEAWAGASLGCWGPGN